MTTPTEAPPCGDVLTGENGTFTCTREQHTSEIHSDGTGLSWKHHPAAAADEQLLATLPHLLWSNPYRLWWRPNRSGYTSSVWHAARYTREQALAEARVDAHENPPRIVAVLAPEAGTDGRFTVDEIAAMDAEMERRVAAATKLARRQNRRGGAA